MGPKLWPSGTYHQEREGCHLVVLFCSVHSYIGRYSSSPLGHTIKEEEEIATGSIRFLYIAYCNFSPVTILG